MSSIAEQAWQEVLEQQQEPTGRLSITAPHAIMDSIVVPSLTNTFSLQSQLSLNLICHDQQLDLMAQNLDLAIRVGESQDSSYKQQRVGSFRDVLCCAKNYQATNLEPVYIANHWQAKHIEHRLTNKKEQSKCLSYEATHRVNTLSQVIQLIESGVGIGIVPDFIFQQHSGLEEVLPGFQLASTQVYALHPYHHAVPLSVSMAIISIKQTFEHIMEK